MSDSTGKWAEWLSAVAATGSWIASLINRKKIKEVHVLMNSRLTELLRLTKAASFAEGEKSQKDKQEKDE